MHMYGRYEKEIPTLTFGYERQAPRREAFTNEELINNYVELQTRLRENNLSFV